MHDCETHLILNNGLFANPQNDKYKIQNTREDIKVSSYPHRLILWLSLTNKCTQLKAYTYTINYTCVTTNKDYLMLQYKKSIIFNQ
ncbi:hypothetical protein H8356DRAFT_1352315 [Neocallimastix lanati (nom. inval.)]|nr:hypothetical protein H8356DRAFT_1352315 [Neocallimastix sp. JGI-2020a]